MSIATQCSKCKTGYKVKDELAGKRFVCKVCQSPVAIPAKSTVEVGVDDARPDLNRLLDDEDASDGATRDFDPAQETSTDLEMYADTSEELVLKRTSSFDLDESSGRTRTAGRSWITRLQQNPLSIPGLAFFFAWAPFSYLEIHFAWVVNIILGLLCLAGIATVKVLELLEIRFDNPLVVLNLLAFGSFTALPASRSSSSGVLARKKSHSSGYDLVWQLSIMLGFLIMHTAVLSLKWYPLW